MSDKTVEDMVFSVRKCAHVTEYAVLSLLVWRALRRPVRGDARGWDWRSARLAFVTAVLYAGTDEFHQLFVRGREARVHDVGIDACGAGAALAVLWLLGRWRREW